MLSYDFSQILGETLGRWYNFFDFFQIWKNSNQSSVISDTFKNLLLSSAWVSLSDGENFGWLCTIFLDYSSSTYSQDSDSPGLTWSLELKEESAI